MNRTSTTARRTILASLLALGVTTGSLLAQPAPSASAQTIPPRPIPTIVVPPILQNLPDLTVSLAPSQNQIDSNGEFTLKATVKNPGNVGTAGIALNLTLDEATFLSNLTPANERENFVCQAAVGAHQISCTGGLLEGNGDAQLQFKLKGAANAATMTLSAQVDPNGAIKERSETNNSAQTIVRVVPLPDLVVSQPDGPEALNGAGVDVSYRFTVTNQGGGEASGVKVSLALLSMPLKFQVVDLEGSRHGLSCAINSNHEAVCQGGTLPVGQSVTIRLDTETQVHVGANPGVLKVQASETQTDRTPANNTAAKAININ